MTWISFLALLVAVIITLVAIVELLVRSKLNKAKLVDKSAAIPNAPSVIPYVTNPPTSALPTFLFGLLFGQTKPDAIQATELVEKQIKNGNKVKLAQTIVFGMHFIYSWNPEHFKIALGKNSKFSKIRNFVESLKPLFDQSVASVEGEQWKNQRQIMNPSFQFEHVKNMMPGVISIINNLAAKWEPLAAKSTSANPTRLEIMPWFNKMTLDVIGKAGFGFDFNALSGGLAAEYQWYTDLIAEFTNPLRLFSLYEKLNTTRNKKYNEVCKNFTNFLNDIAAKKQQMPKKEGDEADLLDMLIAANSSGDGETTKLTDIELNNNIMIFFLAGHETTSNTLSFTFGLFGKYPEIQEKARKEVDTVTNGRIPTFEDIKQLTYINAIIKESMRMYPTAFGVSRVAQKGATLGGYEIPEGSLLLMLSHAAHMDSKYWGDDVAEFKPERWLTASAKSCPSHPFAYMPFGLGPRKCLGMNFALLEMKICICIMLQRYSFAKLDDFEFTERTFTYQPQQNFAVNIFKRE